MEVRMLKLKYCTVKPFIERTPSGNAVGQTQVSTYNLYNVT